MDFKVGDAVEIFDYKEDLNDNQGLIVEIKGDRARVWIPDVRRGVTAMIPLDKLRKVDKTMNNSKEGLSICMLTFFVEFAELLKQALAYLELDEGIESHEVHDIEVRKFDDKSWTISFPQWSIEYFASCWTSWSGQEADWQFSR